MLDEPTAANTDRRREPKADPQSPSPPGDDVAAAVQANDEADAPLPAPSSTAPETPAPPPLPPGHDKLDDAGLDLLFRNARTHWTWRPDPVDDATIRNLYDLLKFGPTSANCSPARFMFLRSQEAKQRLRPALSEGNAEKAMAAPFICIVAHDPSFYEDLPRLYPEADARSWFAGNEDLADETAFRNGTLQGAYLIIAARALGLDCGPMSGFDNAKVNDEFFAATGWRSNFLVALGYAETEALPPRAPRFSFDEACRLL